MPFSPALSASRQTLVLLAVLLAYPVQVSAADDDTSAASVSLPPVVVTTPTRLPTPESEVGSSITVIPSEEIERKQEWTLPDALKDVPGLNVIQTGGPGGQTSVFLRGANANQTKVFIDGIDATDPATGTFNFEHILTWDIATASRSCADRRAGSTAPTRLVGSSTSSRRQGRGRRNSGAASKAVPLGPSTRMSE